MPRNWQHIEDYLDRLAQDVYPEPITKNHRAITIKSFRRFVLPHRAGAAPTEPPHQLSSDVAELGREVRMDEEDVHEGRPRV
jgi:hypothetical protein